MTYEHKKELHDLVQSLNEKHRKEISDLESSQKSLSEKHKTELSDLSIKYETEKENLVKKHKTEMKRLEEDLSVGKSAALTQQREHLEREKEMCLRGLEEKIHSEHMEEISKVSVCLSPLAFSILILDKKLINRREKVKELTVRQSD